MKFTIHTLLLIATLGGALFGAGEPGKRIADLRGLWQFEIGDNPAWAARHFDDSEWVQIFVPSPWEEEGFPGYDGFAWYRRSFRIEPLDNRQLKLILNLGRIDDVDQVFVNGYAIGGSGRFEPMYETAYAAERRYVLPRELIDFEGDNVIAVRVFDLRLAGGILEGRPGIYTEQPLMPMATDLEGLWKFMPRDIENGQDTYLSDAYWDTVNVPCPWEMQGYDHLDGIAWYRKTFTMPASAIDQPYLLLLGQIDDIDQSFLNGMRIGESGFWESDPPEFDQNDYAQLRAYRIPDGLLRFDGDNLVAIRVYDGLLDGGIRQGPVGIVAEADFRRWQEQSGGKIDFWRLFLMIFK